MREPLEPLAQRERAYLLERCLRLEEELAVLRQQHGAEVADPLSRHTAAGLALRALQVNGPLTLRQLEMVMIEAGRRPITAQWALRVLRVTGRAQCIRRAGNGRVSVWAARVHCVDH